MKTNRAPGFWSTVLRVALVAAMAIGPREAASQSAPLKEYQLKAVFLFHFTQFVEWPESAFPDADAPLVIGILGKDPFGSFLDDAVRGEKVGTHPLLVHRFERAEDVTVCHILFVPASEGKLGRAFTRFAEGHILTVGDAEEFARRGGVVAFANDNNRIRLLVNMEAAEAAGLKLSSKLLRPAEIVTTKKE